MSCFLFSAWCIGFPTCIKVDQATLLSRPIYGSVIFNLASLECLFKVFFSGDLCIVLPTVMVISEYLL